MLNKIKQYFQIILKKSKRDVLKVIQGCHQVMTKSVELYLMGKILIHQKKKNFFDQPKKIFFDPPKKK